MTDTTDAVSAVLRVPAPLRGATGGASEVQVEAATVREALHQAGLRHEALLGRVLGDDGELRAFVNLYVGAKDVRELGGLDARLRAGDVISILPAVAGGAR